MKHEVGDKVRIKQIPAHTINGNFSGEKAIIINVDDPIYLLQLVGKEDSAVNKVHLTENEFINLTKL